jgi:hypothetical protein
MSDEAETETCERCGIGSEELLCDDCERADNPNAEALRLVRECLTPEARAALGHLLNNALAPVVMEADMQPWCTPPLRAAVWHLRDVIAEVLR